MFAEFAKTAHVPGAAWGIVIDGELAHSGAAGVRDVAANAPVDADTVFRIASMTKSFTAMAILKLRDEGKLGLDDPAERYVPELKGLRYPTTDSPRITIRHLLTHSEGFPEDNPWGDQQLSESEAGLSRMLRDGIPFSNAPGIAYEYSNYGFAILGRVVSQVSGRPYDEYVSQNILQPLGMTSTTLHPSKVAAEPAGGRVSLGRRALEGRAGAPARVIRRDGRDADVDPRLEPLRLRASRGVAAAGRPGARPDPPGVAPRNAAALAPRRHARRARQVDERHAPDVQRLRVWPPRDADVPVPHDGRPRRGAARVRIAHAMAPRLRHRHHRVRQRHLHRLERRGRGGDRSPGPDRRSAASRDPPLACARLRARRRLEAGRGLGRRAGRQDCRREPVHGPFERSAPQGARRSAREGRRLFCTRQIRRRRKRAARSMDDDAASAAGCRWRLPSHRRCRRQFNS